MKLEIAKFGTTLISRPAGREAGLAALAYSFPQEEKETIELDFTNVNVLTPSWTDAFVQTIQERLGKIPIRFLPSSNSSVQLTIQTLQEMEN